MKKVLSLVLALVMMLSIGAIGASAAEYRITVAPTVQHVRQDDIAYYPVKFDVSKINGTYAELCESNGFAVGTTHIELGYSYRSDTLSFVDAIPEEALYNLGGTVKVTEHGTEDSEFNYFFIEIDFSGSEGLANEYFFNLKFEVLQEKFINSLGVSRTLIYDYPIYADYENMIVEELVWEVTDSNGTVHDLSSKIDLSYASFGDGYTSYDQLLIKDYEPFIPPVEEDIPTGNLTKITYIADNYHVRKGEYAYFPVYYDCQTPYKQYTENDSGSHTKIIFPFLYNSNLLKPIEAIPSEQLYNIGGTVKITKIDEYVDEDDFIFEPYIYVEVNFDGCADIANGVLFNIKFEVISENFFDEYGRLDMGGLFAPYFIIDVDSNSAWPVCDWKTTKSDGTVKDISSYVVPNNVAQFEGTTYDELLLKDYEPFIPNVESDATEETYIPVSEANSFWSDRIYSISSEEEFMLFVKKCYNILAKSKFVLTTDLTFYDGIFSLDENQTPLYNGGFILPEPIDVLQQFSGIFDGQGHTISGLYVNDENEASLFGRASARISNVNIKNSLFISEDDAGSICVSNSARIENCSSDAIVIGKSTVGGIIADAQHGSIYDCFFNGTVVLEKGGNAQTKHIGGIIGYVGVNLINCVNAGDVYNKANGYCGGVAGRLSTTHNSENEYLSEVVGCANTGRVFSKSPAGNFAGRIVGGHVVDCYAAGEVYSEEPSNFMAEFSTNKKPVGNYWDSERGFYDNFINCRYVARYGDTVDYNGEFNTHYEWYLKSRKTDPEDGTLVIDDIGISPIEEETLRNNISGESKIFEGLVCDTGNENKGYPLPKSLQHRTVAPSITNVEYIKSYETRNTFDVTVNGRPAMIQFIEPTGGTRTYDRNHKNVTIKSYDADGNEVNSLDRTAAYEVWSIYSNMMPNVEIRTRAKYLSDAKYTWDSETYDFPMIHANPIISMELSATSGKKGPVPATVVADDKTEKVMFKMPNGTSVTVASTSTDENGNKIFTGNAWMNEDGINEIRILIYRNKVWRQVGTLEYVVN